MTFALGYLGRVAQTSGDYGAAFALQKSGGTAYAAGELADAQARYQESLFIYRAINSRAEGSVALARLALAEGQGAQAAPPLRFVAQYPASSANKRPRCSQRRGQQQLPTALGIYPPRTDDFG